jgi:hypothetical protein
LHPGVAFETILAPRGLNEGDVAEIGLWSEWGVWG